MKHYRLFLYSGLLFCFLACPKAEEKKDSSGTLFYLYITHLYREFDPWEHFCRDVNDSIPNNQEVFVNITKSIKQAPGPNGTNLGLTILENSGCRIQFQLNYCNGFDSTLPFESPPPDSGTCNNYNFSYLEGPSGSQINCSINRSDYSKFAIHFYALEASEITPTTCDYSIQVTDF